MVKKSRQNMDKKGESVEEVLIAPSSQNSTEELPEEEVKSSNDSNQNITEDTTMEVHENNTKSNHKKNNKQQLSADTTAVESLCFPTSRINRIIRSEGADSRLTHEAVFLINKATEQFLEVLCEDVYRNVERERRKAVEYKHVSSAVSKARRYDFLSDFVPEKIRTEDALSERLAGI